MRAGAACGVRWNHYTERNVIERNDLWVCSSPARAPSAPFQRGVSKTCSAVPPRTWTRAWRRRCCTPARRIGACSSATSCGWRRSCRSCRPPTWCCSTCSATSWTAWARSTASRTASWARWRSRRTRCWCTTPTTRCAFASPSVRRTPPSRSAWTRTWGYRRIRWPTRRCASAARPCWNTTIASTGNWDRSRVPPAGSRVPPWTSRQRA